jgi:hypothetical protein
MEGFDISTFAYCSSLTEMVLFGDKEQWIAALENSVVEEDLCWYEDTGDFVIQFVEYVDGDWETSYMTKAELIELTAFEDF